MAEITVVIPAYNSGAFLRAAIESVIAQTRSDWELIVVDDGSSDGSFQVAAEVSQRDARVKAHRQANGGVAKARNEGLSLAGGEASFVMFLDHDDQLEPDALEDLRAVLLRSPTATAAYGFARHVDESGRCLTQGLERARGYERHSLSTAHTPRRMSPEEPDGFDNLVGWASIFTPGQVLIRARDLARAGPFDPGTVPSDDWDLWIRLSRLGPLLRVMRFTLDKLEHEGNESKRSQAMRGAEPRLRQKLAADPSLTPVQRQLARLGHAYSCRQRLVWAREQLEGRRYATAARSALQAFRSAAIYWRTRY